MGCCTSREKADALEQIYKFNSDAEFTIREATAKDYDSGLFECCKSTFNYTDNARLKAGDFQDILSQITGASGKYIHKVLVVVHNNEGDPKQKIIAAGTVVIRPSIKEQVEKIGYIEDIVVRNDLFRGKVELKLVQVLKKICTIYECEEVKIRCPETRINDFEIHGFSKEGASMEVEVKETDMLRVKTPLRKPSDNGSTTSA